MKSVGAKITLLTVLLSLIPLLVTNIASNTANYLSVITSVEENLKSTATLAAARIEWELKDFVSITAQVGCDPVLSSAASSDAQKQEVIDNTVKNYGFNRGTVIDANGDAINGNNYSDRAYFKNAMNGKTTITEPMVARSNGQLSVIIAAPLWKDGKMNTEVVGCVWFVPEQEFMNDIMRDIKVSENSIAYMIDSYGNTIADVDSQVVLDGENIEVLANTGNDNAGYASLAAVHSRMRALETGYGRYQLNGQDKYIGFAPVNGTNGWSVAIVSPAADYLGNTYISIIATIISIIVVLIITIILSIMLGKRIGNPIKMCVERINKLADGDLKSPVPVVRGKDETAVLAQSTEVVVGSLNSIISDIHMLLSTMADGKFDVTSQVEYKGDFSGLIESVKEINKKLSATLSHISMTGDQVSSGSEQVSAGAQALAQGATEQAASIEELAASIRVITEQVNTTAENCEQGKLLVQESSEYIENANMQMQRLTEAMQDISAVSNEINNIIRTIEDIAFQTNILALNAAVEAARVGEAGKGFAVVADEVRNLASKSADAAHNTTILIERTVAAIENGTAIAGETAQAVAGVEERSKGVSEIVAKIADASVQQSDMIKQVNIGVDQISSVVQTNSATAEESAAASEELSAQANVLKDMVGQFTFSQE